MSLAIRLSGTARMVTAVVVRGTDSVPSYSRLEAPAMLWASVISSWVDTGFKMIGSTFIDRLIDRLSRRQFHMRSGCHVG